MTWEDPGRRLEGERVVLEPLQRRHADDLFAASRDPATWRWLPRTRPDRRELDALIAEALAARDAGTEVPFALVERATGRAIGSTRYLALRPEHRGLEVGWTWLDPAHWSTGANVEGKLLLLDHAFGCLRCIRVEFKTDARNERSRAALAALPAQFEGIFRRHMVVPGGLRDSAWYSIIVDDWPQVRENLRRRLAGKRGVRQRTPALGDAAPGAAPSST
ncbi:MAG TPA: GNAT family protein [Solirubrobacteraceae bacterium]|nr:GNAT family protein [Solirubrobacteraceae bacterium]